MELRGSVERGSARRTLSVWVKKAAAFGTHPKKVADFRVREAVPSCGRGIRHAVDAHDLGVQVKVAIELGTPLVSSTSRRETLDDGVHLTHTGAEALVALLFAAAAR